MASFRVNDCNLEIDCHRNNCPRCHDVHLRFPARVNNPISNVAGKVVTAQKMKLQQKASFLIKHF